MVTVAVVVLVVIIILGALSGGQSFGDTVGKGCGCLVLLVLALLAYVWYSLTH